MTWPAHILLSEDETEIIQSVYEHSVNVAEIAASCLRIVGLEDAAYLAGILHDIGKYQSAFSDYLARAVHGEPVKRGEVIHSFQGCRMLLEHFHNPTSITYADVTAELLAYAVGAHHGLFDCIGPQRESGFFHRLQDNNTAYDEVCSNSLEQLGGWMRIENLFERANRNLLPLYDKLQQMSEENHDDSGKELSYYLGFLARLLLSAVIEGDRRDTLEFMRQKRNPEQCTHEKMSQVWGRLLDHLENKLNLFPKDTPIQVARRVISDNCLKAARLPGGVYRLNVPTGAGKTLSSLRFALAHAKLHGLRRIVFTAPLLTIVEQNSAVIREYLGDDRLVLEHHSNLLRTETNEDTLDERELLTENWNAPVIITTMVQLLNTLFLGKTSSIRRFQALCGSVIVIDEVQTVPNRMLSMFNLAVNFLSEVCGTTILLCSATQPCLETVQHPLLRTPKEIVPYDKAIWTPFDRTELVDAGSRKLEEIPAFVQEALRSANSLLVVCNKKDEASYLFRAMSQIPVRCFHLSAAMCTAHRRDTLQAMNEALKQCHSGGPKVLCLSTQVIEAGVDISFERVIRLLAGMDSMVQSAGRCNRNGESPVPSNVSILDCADESLTFLKDISDAKLASQDLLHVYSKNPERFRNSLASNEAIQYYYMSLYRNMKSSYQDFPTVERQTILDLLSLNTAYADEDSEAAGVYTLNQAFKTAGSLFKVFDDGTVDVVVPYGEGLQLIDELNAHCSIATMDFLSGWLERVKPFTVSLYAYQFDKLKDTGGILEVAGVFVLRPELYQIDIGFSVKTN